MLNNIATGWQQKDLKDMRVISNCIYCYGVRCFIIHLYCIVCIHVEVENVCIT